MNQFLTVFSVHYRFSVFSEINDDDDDDKELSFITKMTYLQTKSKYKIKRY